MMREFKRNEPTTFDFKLEGDDRVWSIPLAKDLPAATLLKLDAADGDAAVLAVMEFVDETCPGLLEAATMDEVAAIMTAWREVGGDLGES